MRVSEEIMSDCCHKRSKTRTEEEKRALVSRINRISGQLTGVKKMIEEDRYCDDVLIQLSAIEKAVKGLACIVFEEHVHSCLVENIQSGNIEAVDEVVALFKRFQ